MNEVRRVGGIELSVIAILVGAQFAILVLNSALESSWPEANEWLGSVLSGYLLALALIAIVFSARRGLLPFACVALGLVLVALYGVIHISSVDPTEYSQAVGLYVTGTTCALLPMFVLRLLGFALWRVGEDDPAYRMWRFTKLDIAMFLAVLIATALICDLAKRIQFEALLGDEEVGQGWNYWLNAHIKGVAVALMALWAALAPGRIGIRLLVLLPLAGLIVARWPHYYSWDWMYYAGMTQAAIIFLTLCPLRAQGIRFCRRSAQQIASAQSAGGERMSLADCSPAVVALLVAAHGVLGVSTAALSGYWRDALDWLSSVIFGYQPVLIAILIVLGLRRRWSSIFCALGALLVFGCYEAWFWRARDSYMDMAKELAPSLLALFVVLIVLRIKGFAMRRAAYVQTPEQSWSFSVRDLILLTTAVAVVMGLGTYLRGASLGLGPFSNWADDLSFGITIDLIALFALWAALSSGNWAAKAIALFVSAAALGVGMNYVAWYHTSVLWYFMWGTAHATIFYLTFCALRGCGYQLCRARAG